MIDGNSADTGEGTAVSAPHPATRGGRGGVMELAPGVALERHRAWNALAFDRERPVLSSAPVGGGDIRARRVVNLCVRGDGARVACDDPAGTFASLAAEHGWDGPLVGLMTGVPASRLGIARRGGRGTGWLALATAGTRNAHRAGDAPARADGPGTINVVAVTPRGLTAGARVEAVALVTEARAAVLADLGINAAGSGRPATGTGTDAVAVIGGEGDDTPYTGYHTRSGHDLVAAVRAAIARSLRRGSRSRTGLPGERT